MKKESTKKVPAKKTPIKKESAKYIDKVDTAHSVADIEQVRSTLKAFAKEIANKDTVTTPVSIWERLGNEERIQAGDRPIHANGQIGNEVLQYEIGLIVRESGYFGIVRQRKEKK